jgi:anti-anti-sigma regulatory factor
MEWPWSLHIDVRQTAETTYVTIEGYVDTSNVESLAFELDDLHDDSNPQVVLDLRSARLDGSGLEVVARAQTAAQGMGKRVTTLGPDSPPLDRVATA